MSVSLSKRKSLHCLPLGEATWRENLLSSPARERGVPRVQPSAQLWKTEQQSFPNQLLPAAPAPREGHRSAKQTQQSLQMHVIRGRGAGPYVKPSHDGQSTYVMATLLPSITMCFRSVLPGSFFNSSL